MNGEAQMEKTALALVVERVDRFWKPSMLVYRLDSSIHPLNNWTMVAKAKGWNLLRVQGSLWTSSGVSQPFPINKQIYMRQRNDKRGHKSTQG